MISYPLLLLERILLAAHQGKTARVNYQQTCNKFRMILETTWDLFHSFCSVVHIMQEALRVVLTGTHSNHCTPRQKSRTRSKTDLERNYNAP